MTDLPKTFDPAAIEAKWYPHWEQSGAFRPHRPEAVPYTIVMPPPNVTGSLHIGHALDNTLQDILIRYERLRGKDALWVVGTDHAGIATQMVVERQMAEKQDKRTNYSREDFIQKVWDWKAESGGTITRQLRRLGASCDWANERFTMDEGFSKAVSKVFVDLYNEGLIYRDKRLVNWDPGLKTAISDLEVETREVNGKFWHLRYPLADGATYTYTERDAEGQITLEETRDYIIVATTRPETMLADMAVAVHPQDARYAPLVATGAKVRLPITGRLIPIIADEHADPALGSGAVKITPGHDFNDFEVGKRAGIAPADMINMLDAEARVVQVADAAQIPADYLGLPTSAARKAVVTALESVGALEKVEDRVIQTPFGDRSGQVIEPWLTDQWYVDAKTLAGPAIEAVRSGAIKIVPETWEKTWFQWLENIQPWCISRQLWWGHQIPVWYGPSAKRVREKSTELDQTPAIFVGSDEIAARADALKYYQSYGCDIDRIEFFDPAKSEVTSGGQSPFLDPRCVSLYRDPDVLDTWFSSALWPFGTLGWPEVDQPSPRVGEGRDATASKGERSTGTPSPQPLSHEGRGTSLLARHYPNDVLISGFDILFFWDARMAMQGLHFMKEVPWKTLYLHGLVRAADGSKMSKSKGNTVDPLGLIDQYGADALRFFMAAMESQGRDIKMDEARLAGYRNLATKLWNAARYAQANGIGASASPTPPASSLAVNRWIIGEVAKTVAAIDAALAVLRFDEAANAIYHLVFDTFCDWYLELIKGQIDDETKAVAGWALDQIIVMLHPFMPFITEELWHALGERKDDLILAKWPELDAARAEDAEAAQEISWVVETISKVRSFKAELNIAPGARLPIANTSPTFAAASFAENQASALSRLGRIDKFVFQAAATTNVAQIVVRGETIAFPLDGIIDLDAERARLTKAIEAASKEATSLSARLANPAFVEKAKPEAVEKARADLAEKSAEAERLQAALARLG